MELKREMKVELTIDFREEMANQREDVIITTNTYAKTLNSNLQEVMKKILQNNLNDIHRL